MLFCRRVGQRMKKMRIVSRPHLHRPGLHTLGNFISMASIQLGSELNRSKYSLIRLLGHIAAHLVKIKYVLAEILRHRTIFKIIASGLMGCSLI